MFKIVVFYLSLFFYLEGLLINRLNLILVYVILEVDIIINVLSRNFNNIFLYVMFFKYFRFINKWFEMFDYSLNLNGNYCCLFLNNIWIVDVEKNICSIGKVIYYFEM